VYIYGSYHKINTVLSLFGPLCIYAMKTLYSVSQKKPPRVFFDIFLNDWEFLLQILHVYYSLYSYVRWNTNFYSITCNFDEVMPY